MRAKSVFITDNGDDLTIEFTMPGNQPGDPDSTLEITATKTIVLTELAEALGIPKDLI